MRIKLCGLRRPEDVEYINHFRPDYAGFIFAPGRRQVSLDEAKRLVRALSPDIRPVGVFVNAPLGQVEETAAALGLHAVQLHGDESPEYAVCLKLLIPQVKLWRAVRVRGPESVLKAQNYPAEALVLDAYSPDAYGGTGRTADWDAIAGVRRDLYKPFFVAGGLHAGNVAAAVELMRPEGVDVSGGIETGGCKDFERIRALFAALGRLGRPEDKEEQP